MDKDQKAILEEKYMALQMAGQQIQQLQQQAEQMQQKAGQLLKMKEGLHGLDNSKNNAKSFSQIGSGIFVESEIKDTENLLVNVGADVFVRKSSKDTAKVIDNQLEQAQQIITELTMNLQTLSMRAQQLEQELQELSQ